MKFRTAVGALVLAGMGSLAALPAGAADPISMTCELSIATRVAVSSSLRELPAKVTGTCVQEDLQLAAWQQTFSDGRQGRHLSFDKDWPAERVEVNVSPDQLGIQTWEPAGAFDTTGHNYRQNTVAMDVRLGTGAWLSAVRKGAVVTLRGTSLVYDIDSATFVKRSAGGVFQYRERGTTTWKNLKSVTTNKAGEATMSYTYAKTRDYRFALYSTPISWDLGSAVTTR